MAPPEWSPVTEIASDAVAEPIANQSVPSLWHGDEEALIALTASVERHSEHTLARSLLREAEQRGVRLSEALAFEAVIGRGVQAEIDGRHIRVGNIDFFPEATTIAYREAQQRVLELERDSMTVVAIGQLLNDGSAVMLGLLGYRDMVRPEAQQTVAQLRAIGFKRLVMLTGDNRVTAVAVGRQVGVDETYAALLPDQKLQIIEDLERRYGPVAMIGDGINDAPALAKASIGVAMGVTGTDVARETADVLLLSDNLANITTIFSLSRRTRRTLIANLALAGLLIVAMIIATYTINFPLPLAVIGHEGGTVLVSMNGLRLFLNASKRKKQRRI